MEIMPWSFGSSVQMVQNWIPLKGWELHPATTTVQGLSRTLPWQPMIDHVNPW